VAKGALFKSLTVTLIHSKLSLHVVDSNDDNDVIQSMASYSCIIEVIHRL
jgi:hypothetical protein